MELKLKFIFNMVEGARHARARAGMPTSPRQLALVSLVFVLALAAALPLAAPLAWAQSAPSPDSAAPTQAVVSSPTPAAAPSASTSASPADGDPPDPPPAEEDTQAMFPHFKNSRFWLSGQANFIFQTHPPYPALYSGVHSLSPNYEKATSRVLTLYSGVRLNNSTELLVDIE